jgi:iron complex transport system substrate-binding protein
LRIVSLLPGATEIVCALRLAEHLVGISHECDHPPEIEGRPRLTRPFADTRGLSSGAISEAIALRRRSAGAIVELDEERLRELRPDLVLTQSVCGVCAVPESRVREATESFSPRPRVLSLDGSTLEGVLADIEAVGGATGRREAARRLVGDLRARIGRVEKEARGRGTRPRVVCLEWLDPPMIAGHWIPEMVERAGGADVLGKAGRPSTVVPWDRVVAAGPERLFLLPCGFDAERTAPELDLLRARAGWEDLPAVRAGRVHVLDASAAFSRPGPRLVEGLEALAALLGS